nr:MAG: replication-associated protein [Sclerotinia sclerotiorum umbra-like virus 3-WX1]
MIHDDYEYTANVRFEYIVQASTSWLAYIFAMFGLDSSPTITWITPDWVTALYRYSNRSIILFGAKPAIFSYEIVVVDFLVGVLLLPTLVALAMGVSVLLMTTAYKIGRRGPMIIWAIVSSSWLYTVWLLWVVWQSVTLLLFTFPRELLVFTATYFLVSAKLFFFALWHAPTFLMYSGWVHLAMLCYDLPLLLRWVRSTFYYGDSTAPLPVEQGPGANRVNQAIVYGQALAQQENLAHLSASGALSRVPRLRARGRATRMIQDILQGPVGSVGQYFRGRWTPDLPASARSPELNALLACSSRGMKLLGIGAVHNTSQQNPVIHPYVVVESPEGRELVIPGLDAKLSQYSFLRERTPELLRGLRTRAVDWFKQEELPLWLGPLVLPGAVARSCLDTKPEEAARTVLVDAGLGSLLSASG